ncbi:hypothetical protein [Actinoallomurus rhizosphaericola]|uniref:hypothetical protein n=1 Tax=Actinoallomurus rhizosphaericola TaxID=2952536 RepID=UPI0020939127|nr:hypothetical protein [Actinoallomurus rhizosphaericola]MCO5999791.1 hypothetical protein [Actinoallomurus rhizosphaericola]
MSSPALSLGQFVAGAKRFFDIALQTYTRGDFDLVLMNAAVAVENLSKALLFSLNPAYLVELHAKQFDALLHLTGRSEKAAKLKAPRTIGAKEALARVRQIMEVKTPKDPLDQLIEIRDGALHTGYFDQKSTRKLLTIALRYADEIYDGLESLQACGDDRWGDHSDMVDLLVEESLTDVQHEVNRKVAAARQRLHVWLDAVPEAEQTAVAEARQLTLSHLAGHPLGKNNEGLEIAGELMHCPVCNYPGALCLGVVQQEYEFPDTIGPMDMIEEVASLVDVYIEPKTLTCRVCDVALAGMDELRVAGIPDRLEIEENIRRFFFARPVGGLNELRLDLDLF